MIITAQLTLSDEEKLSVVIFKKYAKYGIRKELKIEIHRSHIRKIRQELGYHGIKVPNYEI